MATKKSRDIISQSTEFIGSMERMQIERMRSEAESKLPEQKKKKTKAQTIKDLRPKQVSIHFTIEEKAQLDIIKHKRAAAGDLKATVEDIIHELVVKFLEEEGGKKLI